MTERSEVDPVVLAGEPDSISALEGGDDDLPLLGDGGEGEPPALGSGAAGPAADEWAGADALLEGQPTELGERPPGR